MEEKQDRGPKRGRVLDRLIQRRDRRVAKNTAHRDMLVREGIIRLVPPFEETVVIDTVRLHKINGRADWKWRAVGLIPPRWGVAENTRFAQDGREIGYGAPESRWVPG